MVSDVFEISSKVVGGAGTILNTILGYVEALVNAVINLF